MTLEQAKAVQTKCEAEHAEAKAEVAAAKAAFDTAMVAMRSEATTKEQVEAREVAVYTARSRVSRAESAARRASLAAVEAAERVARLAPHDKVLARLDRALAAIVAKDAALTNLGLDLTARVAAEVADLRRLIGEADALYQSLPIEVRSADLSAPATAAGAWASVMPDSPALLRHADAAVYRRLGRWPTPADTKPRTRLGGVA